MNLKFLPAFLLLPLFPAVGAGQSRKVTRPVSNYPADVQVGEAELEVRRSQLVHRVADPLIFRPGPGFTLAKSRKPVTASGVHFGSGLHVAFLFYPVADLSRNAHRLILKYDLAEIAAARAAAGLRTNLVAAPKPPIGAEAERLRRAEAAAAEEKPTMTPGAPSAFPCSSGVPSAESEARNGSRLDPSASGRAGISFCQGSRRTPARLKCPALTRKMKAPRFTRIAGRLSMLT